MITFFNTGQIFYFRPVKDYWEKNILFNALNTCSSVVLSIERYFYYRKQDKEKNKKRLKNVKAPIVPSRL